MASFTSFHICTLDGSEAAVELLHMLGVPGFRRNGKVYLN